MYIELPSISLALSIFPPTYDGQRIGQFSLNKVKLLQRTSRLLLNVQN